MSIRVVPDSSKFVRDLRRTIVSAEHTLRVEIPVSLDTSGVVQHARAASEMAKKAAREVKIPVTYDRRALSTLRKDLGQLKGVSVPNLNKQIGIAALAVAAAASVPHILALAGSLTQVAGVAGLLPALLGGAIAGIGTLVVGFQGVGDALKNMADPKKFAEALKNLAPNAREAVKAIKGLSPEFRRLRLDVQQKLFDGLGKTIQQLATTYLPALRDGLGRIASSTNGAFRFVADAARSKGVLDDLRPTLANVATATKNFGQGVAQLVPAFSEISKVGSSFLPGLSKGFASLAGDFNKFIQRVSKSEELKDFIQGGLDAVRDLASVLGSAGRILSGIFKAAEAGGGSVLATFAGALERVADLVNSPAFQSGLVQVFKGLQDAAKPILDSLPSIADALVAVAPGLGDLARAFGTGLGEALKTMADVVVKMAPTFNAWASSLAKLNPDLLALIAGVVVLAPVVASLAGAAASAVTTVGALAPIFGAISGPVLLAVAAVAGLVAGFVLLYRNSAGVREGMGGVFGALQGLWTTLQPIIQDLKDAIIPLLPQVRETFSQVASAVAEYLGYVRTIISGVTAAISFIWDHWGAQITGLVANAFRTVLGIISGAFQIISGIFKVITSVLTGDWSGAWEGIKRIVAGAWKIITSVLSSAVEQVRIIFGGAMDSLKKKASTAWANVQTAVSDGIGKVVTFVTELPGKLLTAIGDLGSLLYRKGQSLIQGLIDGITSKIQAVKDAAGAIAQKVKDFFPGSPVKTGPLVSWNNGGAGKRLVEQLVDGMSSMESMAATTAREIATSIAVGADAAVNPRWAGLASGAGGRQITVEGNVGWGPEDLADAIDEREAREDSLFPNFSAT